MYIMVRDITKFNSIDSKFFNLQQISHSLYLGHMQIIFVESELIQRQKYQIITIFVYNLFYYKKKNLKI